MEILHNCEKCLEFQQDGHWVGALYCTPIQFLPPCTKCTTCPAINHAMTSSKLNWNNESQPELQRKREMMIMVICAVFSDWFVKWMFQHTRLNKINGLISHHGNNDLRHFSQNNLRQHNLLCCGYHNETSHTNNGNILTPNWLYHPL
jgi:hypothetical protein